MAFSEYLESRKNDCKELVKELRKTFTFVSVLGSDTKDTAIRCDYKSSSISDGMDCDCGFVVKMTNGRSFFEYSLDDVKGDKKALAKTILESIDLNENLKEKMIDSAKIEDLPHTESFERESDFDNYKEEDILSFAKSVKEDLKRKSDKILNGIVIIDLYQVSKLFVTENKCLDQNYTWVNGNIVAIYADNDTVVYPRCGVYHNTVKYVLDKLPLEEDKLLGKAKKLVTAKPITPGYYDVITEPAISGLIAHEAFGHGVEMDQFVKDRALAKKYVGDYVASPIVNMKDGANSCFSVASYFFDDDGVMGSDTQIIKDGILVHGLSDMVSASELGTVPTGNGRRESYKRKAYSRMTNTFFEPGKDSFEDMVKSIKHGYLLCDESNGMEDPKNWAIQCVCEYGIEIVDGKLTDNIVSPVIMSGYVPDLLKSITMISPDLEVAGAGHCGKGYKEWVRVSDGGPYLKAKVKLS